MKSWLLHDLGLKMFSIALAAVIWWLIHNRINEQIGPLFPPGSQRAFPSVP